VVDVEVVVVDCSDVVVVVVVVVVADVVVVVVAGSGGVTTTMWKPAPRFWPGASCQLACTSQFSFPSCDTGHVPH
jgi:hypothetical protein